MTEKECLAAGIAVSLFAHFALLIAPRPPKPEPSFTTVVQMDMASPAVATSREKGIGIAAASPRDMDKADAADRKRQAFLRYLDDIDEAVHARRLDGGETGLIGVAEYMFTVRPDGTFTDPVLRASSGSAQPAAKSAAPPSSERNPSPSFCTSNTNTASADRATARQSSRIARRGQGVGLTVQCLFRCVPARRQAVPRRGHGRLPRMSRACPALPGRGFSEHYACNMP